jgi:hypothetical protein
MPTFDPALTFDRRAPMQIALAGGTCSAEVPGPCTGDSAAECPTGYTGTDTFSGKPPTCQGTGVGVSHLSVAIGGDC